MPIVTPEKDPGIFQTVQLKNGITVFYRAYEQTFGLPKVACCVLVNAGGRDDEPGKEGAAHFFEHMPFRGTKNFPGVRELTQDIENNGGYVNAFTSDESTGYEVTVPTEMLEDGIARIADMLTNPLLREEDIETERKIILEEFHNRWANVHFFAKQELYKGLLGNHPIVTAVIGTEESLKSLKKPDLLDFHSRHYNRRNINLFFTGSFDSEQLVSLCERFFGAMSDGEVAERNPVINQAPIKDYIKVFTPEKYNRSVYMLGRLLSPTSKEDHLKILLFRGMLTWSLYSPLYQEIREKRGLAYNLSASHHQYRDVGLLVFTVSTQFANMDQVDTLMWEEINKILANQARFDEVKHSLRQSLLHKDYGLEGILHEAIDDYLDYGGAVSLNDYIEMLDRTTLKDIDQYMTPILNKQEFLNIRVNAEERRNREEHE